MGPGHQKELDMVHKPSFLTYSCPQGLTCSSHFSLGLVPFLSPWQMSACAGNCPQNVIPQTPAIKKEQGGGKAWINEIHTYVHIPAYLCTHTRLTSGLLIAERGRNLVEQAQTVEGTKWQNQVKCVLWSQGKWQLREERNGTSVASQEARNIQTLDGINEMVGGIRWQ